MVEVIRNVRRKLFLVKLHVCEIIQENRRSLEYNNITGAHFIIVTKIGCLHKQQGSVIHKIMTYPLIAFTLTPELP
jgi:hypothetical protein